MKKLELSTIRSLVQIFVPNLNIDAATKQELVVIVKFMRISDIESTENAVMLKDWYNSEKEK